MAQPLGLTVAFPLQSPPTVDNGQHTQTTDTQGIHARANHSHYLLIPLSPVVTVLQMAAPADAAAAPSLLELSSSLGKIGLHEDSSVAQREAVDVARNGAGDNPLTHAIKAADARAATAPFAVLFNEDGKHAVQSPSAVSEIDQEYDDELNYSEDEEAAEAGKAQAVAAAAEQPAKKKKNDVSKPIYARANGFQLMHQSADIARACICCCPHC